MTVGGFDVLSMDQVTDVATAARAVQIPLLATLLLGACAAKARRAISAHSITAGMGPTAMFPVRLRRPMAIGLYGSELVLGAGLLITAGHFGAGPPAIFVRSATALLFGTAVGALHELRGRQPEAGCGCFGDISETPVTWQALARSALLCLAAVATLGAAPLHLPASSRQALVVLAVLAVELVVLAALSPEIGEVMVRLGYSEPCEVRRLPVTRTLAALRGSAHWRRYKRYLVSKEPVDVWREGCWRYVVFPGMVASRRVEVVFAVYLKTRRAPVRAGVFDATAERRSREGAIVDAAAVNDVAVPLSHRGPSPVRPVPVTPSPRPPQDAVPRETVPWGIASQGVPHRATRRVTHHAPRQRHRHSAGL